MDKFLTSGSVVSYAVLVGFIVWLGKEAMERLFAPCPPGIRMITDVMLKIMAVLFFCLIVAVVIAIIVAVYHAIVSSGGGG